MPQPCLRRTRVLAALVVAGCLTVPVAGCAAGDGGPAGAADTTPATPRATGATAPTPTGTGTGAATSTASPGDGAADAQLVEIEVADGQVDVAADRVEVPLGARVVLAVTSDTADELHVHGFDQSVELKPGRRTTLELTADSPGLFEVELHESGLLLVQLEVR